MERNKPFSVRLGASFSGVKKAHSTMRYSFKPSSADWTRQGRISVDGPAVEVRVPSASGGSASVVFRGKADAHKATECVLMCRDGQWTLERLRLNILNLKAEREEKPRAAPPNADGGCSALPNGADATGDGPEESEAPAPAASEEDVDAADLFGDDGEPPDF